MDLIKCQSLKSRLRPDQSGQIVPIAEYFDGNDDAGSIGCNLIDHPGMHVFRDVLTGLLTRSDVEAVYVVISELDPGEDCWPFTDMVLVVGKITAEDLQRVVCTLQPDEVGYSTQFGVSSSIVKRHGLPVLVVWWD